MSWSGWALPWGSDGLLMPVGLYATDVLEMARQFVQLAGLGPRHDGPRSLDAFLSDQNQVVMAVEDRNRACIQASFFSNAFHGKLEEHASAGVRYALKTWILPGIKTRSTTSWWRSWMWASDNFSILEKKLAMDPLPISSRLRGSFTSSAIELLTWPSGSSKAPRDGFCRLDEQFKLAVAQIRFTEIAHTYAYTLYVICKYVRKRSVHVGFFCKY